MGTTAIAQKIAAKKSNNKKPAEKKAAVKKAAKKEPRKSTRVQIKDANGKLVTGRGNSFKCPDCKEMISGPWSFKKHLVTQHKWTPKEAGLREQK